MPRIEAIEYAVGMIAMHPGDLDESGRVRIELFPSGEYVHPKGGKLQIDEEVLGRFKADLDARADRIPLDYDHAFAKGHPKGSLAAGWFVPGTAEIAPGKDGKASLWAAVQLTPRAAQEVRDGEYRFISPEWNFEWRDSTGKKWWIGSAVGATLVLTVIGLLSVFGVIGRWVVG